jgi:hypothetical protein
MKTIRGIFIVVLLTIAISPAKAQLSDQDKEDLVSHIEVTPNGQRDFLVNLKLFDFDSSMLIPWIDEITHIRIFGVDFKKGKDSDGLYQYVDDSKMNEFIAFSKDKNLKIVWTLNLTSFTLEREMNYLRDVIDKGLNIVAFQYGGEFWQRKYVFADKNAKGVVERIRMDGQYRDYLDLLDMWLPPMLKEFPFKDYEHILVTAYVGNGQDKTSKYRREFNKKIFDYVENHPDLKGNINFSYHLYAGRKPDTYSKDEEAILTPDKIDWSYLNSLPKGSRWVVTESGYYISEYSPEQLKRAKKFYIEQSKRLGNKSLMGIHELLEPTQRKNPLALYNPSGLTPMGEMVEDWLSKRQEYETGALNVDDENLDSEDSQSEDSTSETEQVSDEGSDEPVLTSISPQYTGWFQWIHFSHTLTFSNGKSYKRSYWFSSPDFSKDDLGKPLSYFKRVVKSK